MYRVIIKRDGNNPLTGKAQYRVYDCWMCDGPSMAVMKINPGLWRIETRKHHQRNSFINPRKALGI